MLKPIRAGLFTDLSQRGSSWRNGQSYRRSPYSCDNDLPYRWSSHSWENSQPYKGPPFSPTDPHIPGKMGTPAPHFHMKLGLAIQETWSINSHSEICPHCQQKAFTNCFNRIAKWQLQWEAMSHATLQMVLPLTTWLIRNMYGYYTHFPSRWGHKVSYKYKYHSYGATGNTEMRKQKYRNSKIVITLITHNHLHTCNLKNISLRNNQFGWPIWDYI